MPKSLIVPGVSISADFDVSPPLPARSGILGAVGVVDGKGSLDVQSVTNRQDLLDAYGPATLYSFPEVFRALANGVSEVVVSPVSPRSGSVASAFLVGDAGDNVVELRARAVGAWGNALGVRVTRKTAADSTVRNVRVQVLYQGAVIETHDGLVLDDSSDQDLFTYINRNSRVLVAIDPTFETDLPARDNARVAFVDSAATAATAALTKGHQPVVTVRAQTAGDAGNMVSLAVAFGHSQATLNDTANPPVPTLLVSSRAALDPSQPNNGMSVQIVASATPSAVDVRVVGLNNVLRTYTGLLGITDVVNALNGDPDVRAERPGKTPSNLLPAVTANPVALAETRTITARIEGVRTRAYEDLATDDAIIAALNSDGALVAAAGASTGLPDVGADNELYLTGGRDAGLARAYKGQANSDSVILDLVPAPDSDGTKTRFQVTGGTQPGTVRLIVGLDAGSGFVEQERFDNLTMDPDSQGYLPDVLDGQSKLLRAVVHILRTHATHFPAESVSPVALKNGAAPTLDAYQAAIDALANEDDVDLVMAGVQDWTDPALDGLKVQQALIAHCRTQSDNARPRIAIGSIRPTENSDLKAILDHASQVGDRRFVLVAPSGGEGAMAGLLGSLDFFQSPTFKPVADIGVPLVNYTDGQLDNLVGPDGNLCVIRSRRGRGIICLKGIATDGFQISVVRVADRCVRDVKAISDKFIGELNNDDQRNALKQMVVADFLQLAKDGALVPSVDGTSPPFTVDVYGSEEDFAAGIVRVDIAVRPVRAIDYVYATIRVKN